MAAERGADKTICPSEVARAMFPGDWREHMEEIRITAFKLQDEGRVLVTQKGKSVTMQGVKGAVRIKIRN